MSDRKTAAELRAMVPVMWTNLAVALETLTLHLAAVEEEREAAERCEHCVAEDLAQAKRELEAMTRIADEQRERAKSAERARDDWKARHDQVFAEARRTIDGLNTALRKSDAFGHEMAARWHASERLAADALRVGLEECERLRRRLEDEANHRRNLYGELLDCTRVLGIDFDGDTVEQCRDLAKRLGDREKVGEWWEVHDDGVRLGGKHLTADSARKRYVGNVVHVTRWRKKR